MKMLLKDSIKLSIDFFLKHPLFWLVFLSLIFKIALVYNYSFHFYFDQARDAHISRQIFEKGDIKIQGPSASGTSDALFHGVAYYYLIGFIYWMNRGDPQIVVYILALLSSLAVIPIYLFISDASKNKTWALLVGLFFATSTDAAVMGTYLFNVFLAELTIPWLFYISWKVFYQQKKNWLVFLAILMGLTHQATITSLYLLIPLFLMYWYQAHQENKIFLFSLKQYSLAFLFYLAVLGSMLLTQFQLYKVGLFSIKDFLLQNNSSISFDYNLLNIVKVYINKIELILPFIPPVLLAVFMPITLWIFMINKKNLKTFKWVILVWFFSPACLLLLVNRNNYHLMTGLTGVVLIVFSWVLLQLNKSKIQILTKNILIVIYLLANISLLLQFRKEQTNPLSVHLNSYLKSQLELIDKTYQLAQGQPFSISTLTAPHGYATTWAYLYDWYGQSHFGYKPDFFGPDQAGIPAGELLTSISHPDEIHFTIYEPNPGTYPAIREEFEQLQNIYAGSVSAEIKIRGLTLSLRE